MHSIEILPEGHEGCDRRGSREIEVIKLRKKKGSACDGEENFRENGKFPTCKKPIGDGRKQQRNVNIGNAAPAAPPQIRFEIYGLR